LAFFYFFVVAVFHICFFFITLKQPKILLFDVLGVADVHVAFFDHVVCNVSMETILWFFITTGLYGCDIHGQNLGMF
jgi:hypothetical protein